jgi:hypothetical protein
LQDGKTVSGTDFGDRIGVTAKKFPGLVLLSLKM